MKRVFALLLALVITTQLAMPAWAEGTEPNAQGVQTEVTESSEVSPEETEAPAETVSAEATAAPTEADTEISDEPAEAPTEEPTEAEPAEEVKTYRVTFRCTPADLTLVVFPAEGDIDQAFTPEEDGTYLLVPGEYAYLATAEGYAVTEGRFTVKSDATPLTVDIVLDSAAEAPSVSLNEEDILDSGSCGENVRWTLDKTGTLTISGSGDMADYSSYSTKSPWYKYNSTILHLNIMEGVSSIGKYAFYEMESLLDVSIPRSVVRIGDCAFQYCKGLTLVYLPDTLTTITGSDSPFYRCSESLIVLCGAESRPEGWKCFIDACFGVSETEYFLLKNIDRTGTTVNVPEGVTVIPAHFFEGLSGVTNITLPETLQRIGSNAFSKCTGLKSIYIPKSVSVISAGSSSYSPFWECNQDMVLYCGADSAGPEWGFYWRYCNYTSDKLTVYFDFSAEDAVYWSNLDRTAESIVIPDGITALPQSAFKNQKHLQNVVIPGTVKCVRSCAFQGCTALQNVSIAEGVTSIESSAFYGCTALQNVSIAEGVTSIGSSAFSGCTALQSFSMAEGVTSLGSSAFSGCTALQSFSMAESLESIGNKAFSECTALKDIYIPSSVVSIGSDVFPRSVTVYCAPEACPDGWDFHMGSKVIYGISPEEYEFWSQVSPEATELTIPETVDAIPNAIGDYFPKLQTLHIPSSVKRIGERAFSACKDLATVTIDPGVEYIGQYAFMGCPLTKLYLPDGLITIDKYAFWWCSKLRDIRIPGSVKIVSDNAFKECSALRSVTLEDGIEELGCSLFEDSNNIPKLVIPASVRKIGYGLLATNSSTRVEFKGTMRQWAQMQCTRPAYCSDGYMLDGGTCGDLNIHVGEDVIWYITQPKDKYVLTIFGKGAIGDRANPYDVKWSDYRYDIEEVVIEEGITEIGECAFWGCINLKRITLPESLEWINQYAFSWCHSLRTIAIPKNVSTIGYQAFYDCYNLTSINFLHDADSPLDIFDEAFITDGRSAATTVRVRDKANVNPAIRSYDWRGSHRTVSYGFLDCLPKATGITILADGQTPPKDIDMFQTSGLTLTATVEPSAALQSVTWSSSAVSVARVDEKGVVTLVKPGTAVIKASAVDGSKVTAQVTLHVTYLDGSSKLTLEGDVPAQGLQPGQAVRLTLRGDDSIAPENVIFTVPANKTNFGTVDETGLFTAGSAAGTVTVTAALKGDPLNRKASLNFKILPLQAEELSLTAQLPDGFGTLTEQDEEPLLILSKADLTANTTFPLVLQAKDYRGEAMAPGVKWSSSDTAIASVDANGNVTIKSGASGQTAITAQATDTTKNSARFWICVRDYSPRLAETKLNLNTALASGVSTALVESYGNTVESVQIIGDSRFAAALEGSVLTLRADSGLPKGSYKLTLRVGCADGRSYDYALEVKAASALPKVTVKQAEKLNLFYRDSSAALNVTAPGYTITDLTLTGTEDFALDWTDGQPRIVRTQTETAKPNTKAVLQIRLEGYSQPVLQNLNISAGVTAPKLKLSAASSSLNIALNPNDLSAELWILDNANARLPLSGISIQEKDGLAEIHVRDNSFTLTLQKPEKAKLTLLIQDDNWTQSVKLTHSVAVETKLPTLKSASAITLNSYFTQDSGETELILSQKNLILQDVRFVPAAKEGTAARAESDKLALFFNPEDNTVHASMADPDNGAAAGNYSFTCIGVLADGTELPGAALKVTVAKNLPKARLSASSIRLNSFLAGDEQAELTADLTGMPGCTLAGFRELEEGAYAGLDFADGKLTVRLSDENAKSGSYVLTPIVRRDATGQLVTLPTSLPLKITVYTSQKLGVSLSAKGKLDTLIPDTPIVYTINKLTDCQGAITGLTLEGTDAEKFLAELDTSGDKPQIRLYLRDGETYATNATYRVQFSLTVCGRQVVSPVQSLRISQSGTKYTLPANLVLYQSQTAALQATIAMTAPQGGRIGSVTLNKATPQAFLDAIGGMNGFSVAYDGSTANIIFAAAAPGKLKAGNSYVVVLDVLPEGNAENVKPTTLRLTIKVMK